MLNSHCVKVKSDHLIFGPQFEGMTCFEITHYSSTNDLWMSNLKCKYKQNDNMDERKPYKRRPYSVMTSHPIYQKLSHDYGLESKKRRKIASEGNDTCEEE